jgi:hypothetical protein
MLNRALGLSVLRSKTASFHIVAANRDAVCELKGVFVEMVERALESRRRPDNNQPSTFSTVSADTCHSVCALQWQDCVRIAVMSGRRPVVKGLFEAAVNVSSAVMSTAC